MKITKAKLLESRYIVDKDTFDDVKYDIQDDDVVKIVDDDVNEDNSEEEEEQIVEDVRAIISKKDLIKVIKETKNAK